MLLGRPAARLEAKVVQGAWSGTGGAGWSRDRDLTGRLPSHCSARRDRQPAVRARGSSPAFCGLRERNARRRPWPTYWPWRGRPFDEVSGWDPARIETARLTNYGDCRGAVRRVDAAISRTTRCWARRSRWWPKPPARTPLGPAGHGAVPGRPAGRGAAHGSPAPYGAEPRARPGPGPGHRGPRTGDSPPGSLARGGQRAPEPSPMCPYLG